MNAPDAVFCWSGGKDSSYCLHKVLKNNLYTVKYLLTTINNEFKRISMHGVREALLDLQAESLGIPLLKVYVREGTNEEYEAKMKVILLKLRSAGIKNVIFGDIFLKDIKTYREKNMAKIKMEACFPLWGMNTRKMLNDFVEKNFKAITCCTNDGYLSEEWVGKKIDKLFIDQLPANVDPCGEKGEYHSFCYNGPIFKNKIDFTIGEKVYKPLEVKTDVFNLNLKTNGFWFCDLLPVAK